ncbi:hypothetical protein ZEAMMB73_Zm00001d002081 [Zea mays]|uniref:Uncharacterized protein n=1 Tax=Zea mays TaxID=4577 RepID=A0A1D6DW55_MAIZE|nr:hypothetical protein ZEAMMB73_Zm00001d002081 [Zea mays]
MEGAPRSGNTAHLLPTPSTESPSTISRSDGVARLNSFLRRQRAVVAVLAAGDRTAERPTKLVLSDASKSVSLIVAAICYAWMLPSKGDGQAAVLVVNMRRSRMAWCRQAAWLLYHVGVDASALLFTDEFRID